MKKALIAGLIASGLSGGAMAQQTGPGCGVGAMIFEGQSGTAPHVLAATTNGTFGNQTFGMTSGTLGCDTGTTITVAAADQFLNDNMEKVARAMATGSGESLDTLASLLGVSAHDKGTFFTVTQNKFETIFGHDSATAVEVLTQLKSVMQQDEILAKYVG
ncbi:MAG: DUF3015 domain-containing protein [Thiogranum sp.]|nr:DUF3015 domain-containing protein [Thiogranum sp.]